MQVHGVWKYFPVALYSCVAVSIILHSGRKTNRYIQIYEMERERERERERKRKREREREMHECMDGWTDGPLEG